MKKGLTLIILTFFCIGTYFSQITEDFTKEWKGTIHYDGYHMKKGDFNISFNNEKSGLTFTEWEDGELHPCEFKANIAPNGNINLSEFEAKEILISDYYCYFVADLEHKKRGNKEFLKGEFTSFYADGSPCDINGKMKIKLVEPIIEKDNIEEKNDFENGEVLEENISMKTGSEKMDQYPNNSFINTISCFPNPTKGSISLDLSSIVSTENDAAIEIYSIDGQLKSSRHLSVCPSRYDIDLSSYDNGIYLVKVLNGDTEYASKRIVLNK
jgi:hypothetical protein